MSCIVCGKPREQKEKLCEHCLEIREKLFEYNPKYRELAYDDYSLRVTYEVEDAYRPGYPSEGESDDEYRREEKILPLFIKISNKDLDRGRYLSLNSKYIHLYEIDQSYPRLYTTRKYTIKKAKVIKNSNIIDLKGKND